MQEDKKINDIDNYIVLPDGMVTKRKPLAALWIDERKHWFRRTKYVAYVSFQDGEEWETEFPSKGAAIEFHTVAMSRIFS